MKKMECATYTGKHSIIFSYFLFREKNKRLDHLDRGVRCFS